MSLTDPFTHPTKSSSILASRSHQYRDEYESSHASSSSFDSSCQVSTGSSLDRSQAWKHRIENVNAQVQARGVQRAEIEAHLDRIRSSITIKTSGSFGTTISQKTNSTSTSTTGSEHSSLASESSAGSNSDKETIIKKLLQRNCGLVNAFQMRRAQMEDMMVDREQKDAMTEKLEIQIKHIQNKFQLQTQKTKEDRHIQSLAHLEQVNHIEKELEARDEQIHVQNGKLRAQAQELHELREALAETRQHVEELEVEKRRYAHARVQEAVHLGAKEEQMRVSKIQSLCLEKKLVSQGMSVRGGDRWIQMVQTGMVNNDVVSASSQSSTDIPTLQDQRLKQELEVSNAEYSQKVKQRKAPRNACQASADSQIISKDREELQSVSLDDDTWITKIAALEVDAASSHGVGYCGDVEPCRRNEHLEKRLDGNVIEILRLQDRLRIKDRIIAALRPPSVRERLSVRLEATPELAEAHSEYIESYLGAPQRIGGDQVSGIPADESDFSHFYDLQTEPTQIKQGL